jgi:hypothetical protein
MISASVLVKASRLVIASGAAACLLFAPVPARAQQPDFGVRAGASVDPDQFYFGGHVDTGGIFDKVSFRPNAEIGLGNNVTTVAANLEFVYWYPVQNQPWSIYAGAGPAAVVYHVSFAGIGDTSVQGGFNLVLGARHASGFFAEMKVGFIHSPDFKIGIGYSWMRR